MKQKLRCLVLGFLLSSTSWTQQADNLLVNGDAELFPFTENGWVQVAGNWQQRTAGPLPQNGGNYFFSGANGYGELYQEVDVSIHQVQIDSGNQAYSFSGYVRSFDQAPTDEAEIKIEYLDASGTVLDTYTTGSQITTNQWVLFEDNRIAPSGTRVIKVTLMSTRNSGSNNDGYFDNLQLKVLDTTLNNGDWSAKSVVLENTPEAALMVRTGDIDNLGFGWPANFNPFSGNSTPSHTFPWTPEVDDPEGTDRIMVVTSYVGGTRDGYTASTSRPENAVRPITLNFTNTLTITSAKIQLFLDDFQAPSFNAVYQVTLDGIRDSGLENIIRNLSQTGPVGKIITYNIPNDLLYLLDDGVLAIEFDDLTTGAGDGYAIDFVKLLINPKTISFDQSSIQGIVTDATTSSPLQGVTIRTSTDQTVMTDSSGMYTIENITPGLVQVSTFFEGYGYESQLIDIGENTTNTVNFSITSGAPQLISTSPADADLRVDITSVIELEFDQEMNTTSFDESSFILSNGTENVSGSFEVLTNTKVRFIPEADLKANTTYQATITTNLKSNNGLAMEEEFFFSFGTFDPPSFELSYNPSYINAPGATIDMTITTNGDTSFDRTFSFNNSTQLLLNLPDEVTVPAGEEGVTFQATIAETDEIINEAQVLISATGPENSAASIELLLGPLNIPEFTLNIETATIIETDGSEALQLTLERTSPLENAVTFKFDATDPQLIFPSELVFDADETEIQFTVGIQDDNENQGDRTIVLGAMVVFDSCDCTDVTIENARKEVTITILDNDGPSLDLTANETNLLPGETIELVIKRPLATIDPLSVTLTSSNSELLMVPETVTIPADELSTTVSITAQSSTTVINEVIQILAQAETLSASDVEILVSNQDLPDLIIEFEEIPSEILAGSELPLVMTVSNTGISDFPSGASLNVYVSSSNLTINQTPIFSTIINQTIPANQQLTIEETIVVPNIAGSNYVITSVNTTTALNELTVENNEYDQLVELIPAYSINLSLDKSLYVSGESIVIQGSTFSDSGEVYPNAALVITIEGESVRRNFNVQSNASGNFELIYTPLENESGNFTVQGRFPGEEVAPQATFDLLALSWTNKPNYVRWEPVVGIPYEQTIIFENKASVPITEVEIQVPEDAPFSLIQTPTSIAPESIEEYNITITTDEVTLENAYIEVPITITSAEGATFTEIIYFYSRSQTAKLIANLVSINSTMTRDAKRTVEFELTNIGQTAAKNIRIDIPNVPWMSLTSGTVIQEIAVNESETISIGLQATDTEQINVPITGNIAVNLDNGKTTSIPFRIQPISENTGNLQITTTDEYTFNTPSAPYLAGANVTLKHPYSGEIVGEGVTNANGILELIQIPEGYYTLTISAEKHGTWKETIYINPGITNEIQAFLPYQAVTYTWNVEQIEIEDQYEIKLTTEFETNIPKPVVVMELEDDDLDLVVGETRIVNLNVTNYGLIAANDVKIATNHSAGYEVTPSISSLTVLAAKSSIQIPVEISRTGSSSITNTDTANHSNKVANDNQGVSTQNISKTIDSTPDCEPAFISIDFRATYPCADEELPINATVTVIFKIDRSCGAGSIPELIEETVSEGSGTAGTRVVSNSEVNLCNGCATRVINAFLGCNGILAGVRCAIGFFTMDSYYDSVRAAMVCSKNLSRKLAKCPASIYDAGVCCEVINPISIPFTTITLEPSSCAAEAGNKTGVSDTHPLKNVFEDFAKIKAADEANILLISEYFNYEDFNLSDESFIAFFNAVEANFKEQRPFTPTEIETLTTNLASIGIETYISYFTDRWNRSLEAWENGIFSENDAYIDIIDKTKIDLWLNYREDLKDHVFSRGFVSVEEMFDNGFADVQQYSNQALDEDSVCATVTIEFEQTITMTREAFEGTLRINNSSDVSIRDVALDVVITNQDGAVSNDLFQINKDAFLSGQGLVSPDSQASGNAIFIPTPEAAPQVATPYNFGGILSYYDENLGERVSSILNPVTLEVNPSPDLVLDYFVQRNILGDDALTETIVEPSYPAELSILIKNRGYGAARNISIASAQPEIVDNEKGLLLDVELIGSNLNNEPISLGLLDIDFGDLEPQNTVVGQWFFTSSLLGKFVSYEVELNHLTDYGNEALSLISEANVHELIKSIRAYEEGSDDVADFLVNDEADINDTPDRIYFSEGTDEEVYELFSSAVSNSIAPGVLTTELTLTPNTPGWNYGVQDDPGSGNYRLIEVRRNSDQRIMPIENFWQTYVTLPDGLAPRYENKLHFLDKIQQEETYTLFYVIENQDKITANIIGIPAEEKTDEAVTTLQVIFDTEIDPTTFTTANLQLARQGQFVDTSSIGITEQSPNEYELDLTSVTDQSGFFELDISLLGVEDINGNSGDSVIRGTWIQFIDQLGITRFLATQVNKMPIDILEVTFNKSLQDPQTLSNVLRINGTLIQDLFVTDMGTGVYQISGIASLNQTDGMYSLSVDTSGLMAIDGTPGFAPQTYVWEVDRTAPYVVEFFVEGQAVTNAQFKNQAMLKLNEAIVGSIPNEAIQLTRNGALIAFTPSFSQIDDLTYLISGFEEVSQENGSYVLIIDSTYWQDIHGNSEEELISRSWEVNIKEVIERPVVAIQPDLGFSDTDFITSGTNVQIEYSTLDNDQFIDIYEVSLNGEQNILYSEFHEEAGTYFFTLPTIGQRTFVVQSRDVFGNTSVTQALDVYIDDTALTVTVTPVKQTQNECYDFDYVEIVFSEAIVPESFTKEILSFFVAGLPVEENVNYDLVQIDDTTFWIENIDYAGNTPLSVHMTLDTIQKLETGLFGAQEIVTTLGIASTNSVASVEGKFDEIIVGEVVAYQVNTAVRNADWLVLNGEVISSTDTSVTIKWLVEGVQSLMLRYQNNQGCFQSIVRNVVVGDDTTLVIEDIVGHDEQMYMSPVPNDGEFTIHTSGTLQGCEVLVYDLSGRQIFVEHLIKEVTKVKKINLANIAPGVYKLAIGCQREREEITFVVK